MSHALQSSRRPSIGAFHLANVAIYLAILLCWAGVLPAWRLAPAPVQPALQAALVQLVWPAMAVGGAVLFVTVLRLRDGLSRRMDRLAEVGLRVAGIVFACLALRAVDGVPFAGYGLGWDLFGAAMHAGAVLAVSLLPLIAAVVAIGALVGVLRREPQAA